MLLNFYSDECSILKMVMNYNYVNDSRLTKELDGIINNLNYGVNFTKEDILNFYQWIKNMLDNERFMYSQLIVKVEEKIKMLVDDINNNRNGW